MIEKLLSISIALSLSAPALAIDWSKTIHDANGIEVANCPDPKKPDCGGLLTIGDAAVMSLFAQYPDERDLSGEQKYKRALLAMKIRDDKNYMPSAEDVTLIKSLVGKAFGSLIVMRVWQEIDPSLANNK